MTSAAGENEGYVAVTGCGVVAAFGAGPGAEVLRRVPIPPSKHSVEPNARIPDSILEQLPDVSAELGRERSGRIAGAALLFAARQAGVALPPPDPARVGLIFSEPRAGQAGMIRFAEEVREQSPRFVSPIHFPETVGNYLAGALARSLGLRGANLTVCGGTSVGVEAFAEAVLLMLCGRADLMFVGGYDAPATGPGASSGLADTPVIESACFVLLQRIPGKPFDSTAGAVRVRARAKERPARDDGGLRLNATGSDPNAVNLQSWLGCGCGTGPFLAVAVACAVAEGMGLPHGRPPAPRGIHTTGNQQNRGGKDDEFRAWVFPDANSPHPLVLELRIPATHGASKTQAAS